MRRLSIAVFALLLHTSLPAKDAPPPLFVDAAFSEAPPPPADQAQIILVEPINKIQGLFPVGIFRIEGDQRTMVAVTSWRSRAVLNLAPGKHLLMASQGGVGHFMEANVEAGKRYYVLLRFIYAQGMQLRPIRPSGTSPYRVDGKDFPKWIKATRFIERTPEAEIAFDKLDVQLDQAQEAGVIAWQAKTAAEIAELTLEVGDAVAL